MAQSSQHMKLTFRSGRNVVWIEAPGKSLCECLGGKKYQHIQGTESILCTGESAGVGGEAGSPVNILSPSYQHIIKFGPASKRQRVIAGF